MLRRPAARERVQPVRVIKADFTGCSPALGMLTGRYNSILLTNSERPFRGSIRWGGEDSCGGF